MKQILIFWLMIVAAAVAESDPCIDSSALAVQRRSAGLTLDQAALGSDGEALFLAENLGGRLGIHRSEDLGENWTNINLHDLSLPEDISDLQAIPVFYQDRRFLFTGSIAEERALYLMTPKGEGMFLEVLHRGPGEISGISIHPDLFDSFYLVFHQQGQCRILYCKEQGTAPVEISDRGRLSFLKEGIVEDSIEYVFLRETPGEAEASLISLYRGQAEEIPLVGVTGFFGETRISSRYFYGFLETQLFIYRRTETGLELERVVDTGSIEEIRLITVSEVDYLFYTRAEGTELWVFSELAPLMSPMERVGCGLVLMNYALVPDEDSIGVTYYTSDGCVTRFYRPEGWGPVLLQHRNAPEELQLSGENCDYRIREVSPLNSGYLRISTYEFTGNGYISAGTEEKLIDDSILDGRLIEIPDLGCFYLLEDREGILLAVEDRL